MISYKSGNLNILNIDNYNELDSIDQNQFDLIIINNGPESLFSYPTKIAFEFDVPTSFEEFIHPFESSKRSSINKRVKNIDLFFKVEVQEEINTEDFAKWKMGYDKFIASLEDGENHVNADWFATGQSKHIGVFFFNKENNNFEGGCLVKKFEETKKLSMSFAWYSDFAREKGASTYLVYKLIEFAISKSYTTISFGQDTNLYGGHLSLGLRDYKASWKTIVKVTKQSELKKILVVKPIKNKFLFYYFENDNLKPFISYE